MRTGEEGPSVGGRADEEGRFSRGERRVDDERVGCADDTKGRRILGRIGAEYEGRGAGSRSTWMSEMPRSLIRILSAVAADRLSSWSSASFIAGCCTGGGRPNSALCLCESAGLSSLPVARMLCGLHGIDSAHRASVLVAMSGTHCSFSIHFCDFSSAGSGHSSLTKDM